MLFLSPVSSAHPPMPAPSADAAAKEPLEDAKFLKDYPYFCDVCETPFQCFMFWDDHMYGKRHRDLCKAKGLPLPPPRKPAGKWEAAGPWRKQ